MADDFDPLSVRGTAARPGVANRIFDRFDGEVRRCVFVDPESGEKCMTKLSMYNGGPGCSSHSDLNERRHRAKYRNTEQG